MSRLSSKLAEAMVTVGIILATAGTVAGEAEFSFQGEVRAWSSIESRPTEVRELGFRYLPELTLGVPLSEQLSLDGLITGNIYGTARQFEEEDDPDSDREAKAYRLWIRAYSDQAGLRAGLQEISFGPGKILRSLRWFDQKNSRDPTGFTDGVNALLFRYYFENNANIWVWGMAENEDPMGLSLLSTAAETVESGGRIQVPAGSAELGISIHSREAEPGAYSVAIGRETLQENRIGLDLSWDLGVGVYMETTYLRLEKNGIVPESQIFLTAGCDYTFDLGDGLGTVVELMGVELDYADSHSRDGTFWLLAASGQLPLNLLDQLQMLIFHNFETDATTLQASWQRTTDNWVLSLIAYTTRAADEAAVSNQLISSDSAGQDGLRVLLQINH